MRDTEDVSIYRPALQIARRGSPRLAGHTIDLQPATERPRSDMRRLLTWGCALLIVCVGGFGVWAATVPLHSAVIAQGFVKVLSKRKAVQHIEGGIVKTVLVGEGDKVEPGQLLAHLDTTQLEASLAVLETKLFANLALEARLEAEQNGAPALPFPDELLVNAERLEAKLAMQSQEAEFAARSASLEGERAVIAQQISQSRQVISGTEENQKGLHQQLRLLKEEIKDTDFLLAKGLARRPRLLALQRTEADVEARIERNAFAIAESHGKIAELEDRRRQLAYARAEAIAKHRHTTREEIADVRHRIVAVRDKIVRSELRAPERGTVVGLNTRNLNAVLAPRETLLEIVPAQDRLVIEATLRPTDREEVYVGQNARVRVLAFNLRRAPILIGTVSAVSADVLTDAKTGERVYRLEIELHATADVTAYLSSLQPGMPVEAFLQTGERTFADYLLQPLMLRVNRAFRES